METRDLNRAYLNTIGRKTPEGVYYSLQHGTSSSQIIVINFHGNYQSIVSSTSFFDNMKSDVNAIYDVEYRGYANVPGSPDEKSLSKDLKSFIQWVKQNHPNKHIVLGGYSLGASLVLFNLHTLANETSGVIAFSPFSSLADIVKRIWFLKIFIVRDCGWNVLREVQKGSNTPVLIFGAKDDNVVPIELTTMLADELEGKNYLNEFVVFRNGGHMLPFSPSHENKIFKTILSFLQNIS